MSRPWQEVMADLSVEPNTGKMIRLLVELDEASVPPFVPAQKPSALPKKSDFSEGF